MQVLNQNVLYRSMSVDRRRAATSTPCQRSTAGRPTYLGTPFRRRFATQLVAVCSSSVRAAAAQEVEPGKHISSTDIPAFIPRRDLVNQLYNWSRMECEDSGADKYGLPMKVRPYYRNEDELWGFVITILSRDGASLTDLRVKFDDDQVIKHQWVGRGADGFPSLEGNTEVVEGKQLTIRKIDDNPVDEQLREAIRSICTRLMESLNKYYAFGSCFTDDNT